MIFIDNASAKVDEFNFNLTEIRFASRETCKKNNMITFAGKIFGTDRPRKRSVKIDIIVAEKKEKLGSTTTYRDRGITSRRADWPPTSLWIGRRGDAAPDRGGCRTTTGSRVAGLVVIPDRNCPCFGSFAIASSLLLARSRRFPRPPARTMFAVDANRDHNLQPAM